MPTNTPTLSKESFFGIASQGSADVAGSYTAMSNGVLLPLTAPESVVYNPNRDTLSMADYQDFQLEALVRSQGEWWEGDVQVALIPGSTAELIECMQTRGSYNQQYFCSMYFQQGNTCIRRLWDAKITQARFEWTKGGLCLCTLSIVAIDGDATADATGSWPGAALPYQWKETLVELETANSGSVAADVNVEEIDVTLDNLVADPADGLRITTSNAGKLQRLYNEGGIACAGSFTRDFADALVWDDFIASAEGTKADMTLTVSRGGNSITFTIRAMSYDSASAPIAGDNRSRTALSTSFTAHSPNGVLAPITIA